MLDYQKNNPSDILLIQEDSYRWSAKITGPEGSPYEDGIFYLKIDIPKDYPFKPPKVSFITTVYHPNINDLGCVCIDVLYQGWSPAVTINNLMLYLIQLLGDPDAEDPLESLIAS